jgi:hypothetical protein
MELIIPPLPDAFMEAVTGYEKSRGAPAGSSGPPLAIRRHGIASAQAICPSKPSDVAIAR